MRRGTIINSWQDLHTMTSSCLNENRNFDNQSLQATKQKPQPLKATMHYEILHSSSSAASRPLSPPPNFINSNHERAKSVDYSRMLFNETMPLAPSLHVNTLKNNLTKTTSRISRSQSVRNTSSGTQSSTVYINDVHRTQKECEKRELNLLNNRFGNYLDKIKNLATINENLRRQVDEAYRKYMGHNDEQKIHVDSNNKVITVYQRPYERRLNSLRKQINDEVRQQTSVQIRLQRADYDIQFYQNNIKLLSTYEDKQSKQIQTLKQQFDGNTRELEQLKQHYTNREQDLQTCKNQYDEYMKKLTECSNSYDQTLHERLDNENKLCTLKEQISFEQEYFHRRQREFQSLEKIQYDLNKEFHRTEFQTIVKKIRNDFQELNEIRLSELETIYQTKLEALRDELKTKHEKSKEQTKVAEVFSALESSRQEHRSIVEQNQKLQEKLEKLQQELRHAIDQNRQYYENSDREYKKLQTELPELDCLIVHLRENAINLWSEISTYRTILVNLFSAEPPKQSKRSSSTPPKRSSTSREQHPPLPTTSIEPSQPKGKASPTQYRDETTGFIVHIEDGIVWVRI